MPRTVRVKCRIDAGGVLLLNSMMDSYEGLGIVRTVEKKDGSAHMVIYSTDTTYKQTLAVLDALKEEGMRIDDISTEETERVDDW